MSQIEQMRKKGFSYIGHGYLHNIYEKDHLIYKCLKTHFAVNAYHKFMHERAALEFLSENGVPTVRVIDILHEGEILPDTCFMVEERAKGINYKKNNMPDTLKELFFDYLMKIAEIEMSFWGDTKPDGICEEKTWYDFLRLYIKGIDALPEDLRKGYSEQEISDWMKENVSNEGKPYFLVMDSNPENFFWNENNEICSVIDIDHPICGDQLFQVASIVYEWGEAAYSYRERMVDESEKKLFSLYLLLIHLNDILLNQKIISL